VSLSIQIHVDTSSKPLAGSIQPETAAARSFTGWMELIAHLADLLAVATEAPGDATDEDHHGLGSTVNTEAGGRSK
jgi:hypothetical protein